MHRRKTSRRPSLRVVFVVILCHLQQMAPRVATATCSDRGSTGCARDSKLISRYWAVKLASTNVDIAPEGVIQVRSIKQKIRFVT